MGSRLCALAVQLEAVTAAVRMEVEKPKARESRAGVVIRPACQTWDCDMRPSWSREGGGVWSPG